MPVLLMKTKYKVNGSFPADEKAADEDLTLHETNFTPGLPSILGKTVLQSLTSTTVLEVSNNDSVRGVEVSDIFTFCLIDFYT